MFVRVDLLFRLPDRFDEVIFQIFVFKSIFIFKSSINFMIETPSELANTKEFKHPTIKFKAISY